MGDPLRVLRVNAVELLRQPGLLKSIDVTLAPADLDVVHDRIAGDVSIALELESVNDGIAVSGTVLAPWTGQCRRCLDDLSGVDVAEVSELYQTELTDDDAFIIEGNQLDLAPMVREAILLELDAERVCRDDCPGLCPECGVDRSESDCDCVTEVRDERWAVLDGLVLDD